MWYFLQQRQSKLQPIMKADCLILAGVIVVAIMAVCVMVKFATEISVEEMKREDFENQGLFRFTKSMGVISLNEDSFLHIAERFPYVAAVTRNTSKSWSFACFASVILVRWIVTSAHCRKPGSNHRVLIYYDYVRNLTHTHPIIFWRIHDKYNSSNPTPSHDIAIAKLNIASRVDTKSSRFDELEAKSLEASIWKTVATMNKKLFLTNDFEKWYVSIVDFSRCSEAYGVVLDESMFCVDMGSKDDCFVHEFGPVFDGDKVVGVLAMKPAECEVRLAIFTNVSYYTNWILNSS